MLTFKSRSKLRTVRILLSLAIAWIQHFAEAAIIKQHKAYQTLSLTGLVRLADSALINAKNFLLPLPGHEVSSLLRIVPTNDYCGISQTRRSGRSRGSTAYPEFHC
jgi:hypothetical protein